MLFDELKKMDIVFKAAKSLKGPFWYMMMSFYLIYFFYSQVGMMCFSGQVTTQSMQGQGLYYLMNFNDYAMSMITLFTIMVGNNWQQIANSYVVLFGTRWVLLFFISWWVISLLVLCNLVLSFIMEIYGNLVEDVN